MLCLPALTPVANDAHAVGDSGECVVARGNMPPFLASADRWGSLPSCIQRSTSCGSMPSKPRITSFCAYCDGPRRGPPPHATSSAIATLVVMMPRALVSARSLPDERMDRQIIACATLDFVRALGIDYGERRIGLALSDATGLIASPWKTVANDANVGKAAERLAAEIRALQTDDSGIGAIVLGLPRRLSGEPNAQTARVQKLADLLATMIVIPITFQDERL